MTVTCEQFFHTSLPGRGFVTLASPGLPSAKALHSIIPSFDPARTGSGIAVTMPGGVIEGSVALSYLKRELDEYKRPFVHNHTLVLPRADYARMGAHPQLVEHWFAGPEGLETGRDQKIEPIQIEPSQLPRVVPAVEDLQRVSGAFRQEGLLANILWSIEGGRQRTVTLGGHDWDPRELVYSLLRVLPPQLRTFSLATAEASGASRRRFLLTVVHSGRGEASVQVSSAGGQAQGSNAVFLELEQAVSSGTLQDLASSWKSFEHRHKTLLSLSYARRHIVAGELDAAEKRLAEAARLLEAPVARSEDYREYQVLYLEVAKRRQRLDVYWTALNDPTLMGNKPATVAKVLRESSVSHDFKYGLAHAALREYDMEELKDSGVLGYLLGDREGLANAVIGGELPVDLVILALTAQGVRRSPFLNDLFRFEITLDALDDHNRSAGKPRFLQYLDELARMGSGQNSKGSLLRSILDLYVDRMQEALEQEFKSLDAARKQDGEDRRPLFASRALSLLRTHGVDSQFSDLAASFNAKDARKKFARLHERLSASARRSR